MTPRTFNKYRVMAYIPRWRGEAEVVVAGKIRGEISMGLYLFVLEGNGGNSSTNSERITNRITNRTILHLNHTLPGLNSIVY
jgi:D-Tyr-tRNAtyr deacylase